MKNIIIPYINCLKCLVRIRSMEFGKQFMKLIFFLEFNLKVNKIV